MGPGPSSDVLIESSGPLIHQDLKVKVWDQQDYWNPSGAFIETWSQTPEYATVAENSLWTGRNFEKDKAGMGGPSYRRDAELSTVVIQWAPDNLKIPIFFKRELM